MDYDALLAALLAGAVTLLAFLFWPELADQLPDIARMAIIYLVALLAGAWIFGVWRRRRRK
jgi:membrane protein DedA with SNARE-associated domain